ncbi:MAG: hypothetical protein RDV48_27260 [Candidatus Eremiobacteraeota bacterium]|nr:hypothetical protein [Candidatus Eremiobacteraeota bacterium]
MKFNILGIMKAVSDTMAHSKEHAAECEALMKEPVIGYNGAQNVRAIIDPKSSRFTRFEIRTQDFTGKDLVEILGEITISANDALEKLEHLWDRLEPESVKKLGKEFEGLVEKKGP